MDRMTPGETSAAETLDVVRDIWRSIDCSGDLETVSVEGVPCEAAGATHGAHLVDGSHRVNADDLLWIPARRLPDLLREARGAPSVEYLQHNYAATANAGCGDAPGVRRTIELLWQNRRDAFPVWVAGTLVVVDKLQVSGPSHWRGDFQLHELRAAVRPLADWHHLVRRPFPLELPLAVLAHWNPKSASSGAAQEKPWAWLVRLAWVIKALHADHVLVQLEKPASHDGDSAAARRNG